MGNYNRPFLSDEKPDYKVFIEYSSKGAFIAGKKIHAHIEVELIDDSLKKNKFVVIFPDAFNNTFFEEFGSNINNSLSPSVVLQMKDSSLEGDIDLIYFLPNEYKIKIAIDNTPQIPIETNFYPILYNENGVWQLFYHSTSTGNVLIDSKSALHIAPLEEKNQIQYNNNVLILTIWVILLALFQVYLTLLQLNKK